jgi:outer membrane biosynthesis protein TonB
LAERIRGGDAKAISAFRELHVRQMTAYCDVACGPQLIDETVGAAFVDFLGRVIEARYADEELEGVLLSATRAAAAARISVQTAQAECLAVPELLAARTNHELPGDDRVLREHLEQCQVCQGTRTLMERAEQAFWPEPEPAPQVVAPVAEPEPVPVPLAEPEPPPAVPVPAAPEPPPAVPPTPEPAPPEPPPAPEPAAPEPPPARAPAPPSPARPAPPAAPAPPPPIVVRRRSGGLVGAVRKRLRPPLS